MICFTRNNQLCECQQCNNIYSRKVGLPVPLPTLLSLLEIPYKNGQVVTLEFINQMYFYMGKIEQTMRNPPKLENLAGLAYSRYMHQLEAIPVKPLDHIQKEVLAGTYFERQYLRETVLDNISLLKFHLEKLFQTGTHLGMKMWYSEEIMARHKLDMFY